MSRKTKILWGVASAVLVVAGAAVVRWSSGKGGPDVRYESARVDRGRVVARVTATGTLSALVTVQVGSQVSGRVAELLVDFNSPVKKGQVLARIDPQLFQAALEQARANHAAAQGNLVKAQVQAAEAQRKLQRTQALADRKLIAQADLDAALAEAQVAQAQIESVKGSVAQTRAALHQAEVNLAYTTINSPIDGVVISRSVDVGQTVAASLQAPTLFVIAEDLRKMQVDTSVSEADVGKLEAGMKTSFTVDAYPGDRFEGVVRQIRNAPQTVQNVVTYDAVVDVQNPELKLRPGMTANVTFVHAEVDDALRVPNAALRFRPSPKLLAREGGEERRGGMSRRGSSEGGGGGELRRGGRAGVGGSAEAAHARPAGREGPPNARTVWVLRGETPVAVPIRTGVSDGSLTQVLEGELHEGDAVITEALERGSTPSGPMPAGPPMGGGGLRRVF